MLMSQHNHALFLFIKIKIKKNQAKSLEYKLESIFKSGHKFLSFKKLYKAVLSQHGSFGSTTNAFCSLLLLA